MPPVRPRLLPDGLFQVTSLLVRDEKKKKRSLFCFMERNSAISQRLLLIQTGYIHTNHNPNWQRSLCTSHAPFLLRLSSGPAPAFLPSLCPRTPMFLQEQRSEALCCLSSSTELTLLPGFQETPIPQHLLGTSTALTQRPSCDNENVLYV